MSHEFSMTYLKDNQKGRESEGESKSKGKIHLTALTQVTVSNFTRHFPTQSPSQHNAFVISFNWFLYSCGEEALQLRDVDGRPERPSSVTRVRPPI